MPNPAPKNIRVVHSDVKQWYVAYTFPKSEKIVQTKLGKIGVASYLPMYYKTRDWSDRKKRLYVPLFPNYVFIHVESARRHETFGVREIVRYVCFDGRPATIKSSIIDTLQLILSKDVPLSLDEMARPGMPVRVVQGPFAGAEGVVVRKNGNMRLIIQIEALQSAIGVNIHTSDLMPSDSEVLALPPKCTIAR
ncbi:MAG: UpxY family transcription antiterminator [Chitinophagaceae bacterium]|nr:UpxY family transcription antiterminator [Chitinophagaceae bacterium]